MTTETQQFTNEDKLRIAELILERFKKSGFDSQAKFSKSVNLDKADISNLRNKSFVKNPQLIGNSKWIRLARIGGFLKDDSFKWISADTLVKRFVDTQLKACKELSIAGIMCDEVGIGKTYSCKEFALNNPNVFYVDCTHTRSKTRLIMAIAQAVGVEPIGRYDDILSDAIYALSLMSQPLIILDEAGDLGDLAILEIKRIWNGLEDQCGFYVLGSDGLKAKFERGIRCRKVGYKETFSRFGKLFSRAMPVNLKDQIEEFENMAQQILTVNGVTDKNVQQTIIKKLKTETTIGDLRTISRQVKKLRYQNPESRTQNSEEKEV